MQLAETVSLSIQGKIDTDHNQRQTRLIKIFKKVLLNL